MAAVLRPMSVGELLDRCFFLYRKHFLLFVGIAALPHAILLAVQLGAVVLRSKMAAGLGAWSVLWSLAAAVIGFILLIIPGIILSLMWALTIPVAVLEDKGLSDSVARSAELTKGNRGRIFVIYALFLILSYIVMALWEIPILVLIGVFTRGHNPSELPVWSQVAFPVGSFLTQSLVSPLLTIALSLVYYDQRVRKEGFDLELMMSTLDGTQGQTPATAV